MDAPGFTASLVAGGVAAVGSFPNGGNTRNYGQDPMDCELIGPKEVACLIRVPSEVVKQRAQVSASSKTLQIFSTILSEEGIQGLYRGYKSTVLRECGFAAAVTTPLDVAKTRIMLAKAGSSAAVGNVLSAMHGVWRSQGLAGLFAGVFPRMAAISMGGFIFLGAYDQTRSLLLEVGRKSP
ncbi:S-adenosylmethionine mitochondrial carrier protein [Apodemus speciosus]|uniref:Mitochondrial S-adenosylmethionine carrier protein n=1 Tax=Apodemus speciosus TaxID=105296 RepID=A0ABQ0EVN0_APOSI